jgi:hypothetical protein
MAQAIVDVAEQERLNLAREAGIPWKKWGPYLSERQWGTVREDYSESGDAWNYFTHDQSRSRAYRWGEDGMGGLCDDKQRLCFALALWNERDPILKERLFGLTNSEGNHGEDVKEYYFYLDSTPTHSYMKYLYKYPQREYPYSDLVETNRRRSREEPEYELLDTGVFANDRYFDVFLEYAKESPEDVLIRITVHNRGPEAARLRLLPTLWFRNTWSWGEDGRKPLLREVAPGVIQATHHDLGEYWLICDAAPELLFTENESNTQRLWGQPNASSYVKDGFHTYIISGQGEALNPAKTGTKAAAHYLLDVPAGGSGTVRLRLAATKTKDAFVDFEKILNSRIADADESPRPMLDSWATKNGGCYLSLTRRSLSEFSPTCSTKTSFSDLMVFALSLAITRNIRSCFTSGARNTQSRIYRRNRIPGCSAATPIGGDRCGCLSMH